MWWEKNALMEAPTPLWTHCLPTALEGRHIDHRPALSIVGGVGECCVCMHTYMYSDAASNALVCVCVYSTQCVRVCVS